MSGAFLFIIYNLENWLPTMLLGSLIGGVALVTWQILSILGGSLFCFVSFFWQGFLRVLSQNFSATEGRINRGQFQLYKWTPLDEWQGHAKYLAYKDRLPYSPYGPAGLARRATETVVARNLRKGSNNSNSWQGIMTSQVLQSEINRALFWDNLDTRWYKYQCDSMCNTLAVSSRVPSVPASLAKTVLSMLHRNPSQFYETDKKPFVPTCFSMFYVLHRFGSHDNWLNDLRTDTNKVNMMQQRSLSHKSSLPSSGSTSGSTWICMMTYLWLWKFAKHKSKSQMVSDRQLVVNLHFWSHPDSCFGMCIFPKQGPKKPCTFSV